MTEETLGYRFPEFIRMVLSNEPIEEMYIGKYGIPETDEPDVPAKEEKSSFFGKLFRR